MAVKMVTIGQWQLHPMLAAELKKLPNVEKDMATEFTPSTGCGHSMKHVTDLFFSAAVAEQDKTKVFFWNRLCAILAEERRYPKTIEDAARDAAHVIQVYMYG